MERKFTYSIPIRRTTSVGLDISNNPIIGYFNQYIANCCNNKLEDPDQLRTLLTDQLIMTHNGYMHIYVSNGSSKGVNFNDFLITTARGKTRQINDYYPYGLAIAGIHSDENEYLNKYTSKELQTADFASALGTGLEMYDFHARFYDPQLGRWFTPDPAEQFSNPYLAMGNNPVVFVDPDGEWIWIPLALGAITGGLRASLQGSDIVAGIARGLIVGGISAMFAPIGGAGISLSSNIGLGGIQGAAIGGIDAYLWDNNIVKGIGMGAATGAAFALGTSEQLRNAIKGKGLITNQKVLKNFRAGKYTLADGISWQDAALEHFNFFGEYNPGSLNLNSPGSAGAAIRNADGYENILYGDEAFESFDNLRAVFTKENFHMKMPLNEFMELSKNQIEFDGFVHIYENQALFRNVKLKKPLGAYASGYGKKLGMTPNFQPYWKIQLPWGVHYKKDVGGLIFNYAFASRFPYGNWYYKIPRRW